MDRTISQCVADLLRETLKLPSNEIRCTSVDEFSLSTGVHFEDILREEAREARAFVAIVSRNSLQSPFVCFELGARWGANRPIRPLLAAGIQISELPAPLNTLHAVSCEETDRLHGFVRTVAEDLGLPAPDRSASQTYIKDLAHASTRSAPALPDTIESLFQTKLLPFIGDFKSELERLLKVRETQQWKESIEQQHSERNVRSE